MPIPSGNISNNAADIYSASLTYEKMGKCGSAVEFQSIVLCCGETWDHAVEGGQKGWKLVCLSDGGLIGDLEMDNVELVDAAKLVGVAMAAGFEVMGGGATQGSGITKVMVEDGVWILYRDCPQS